MPCSPPGVGYAGSAVQRPGAGEHGRHRARPPRQRSRHRLPASGAGHVCRGAGKPRLAGCAKGADIWLAEQTLTGADGHPWPLELYLTPDPLERLNGWRHLSLMAALLSASARRFITKCCACALMKGSRRGGHVPFAGPCRRPYAALLTLEGGELAPLVWQPRATGPHFTSNFTASSIPVPLPATSTGPSALSHEHPLYQRHSPVPSGPT